MDYIMSYLKLEIEELKQKLRKAEKDLGTERDKRLKLKAEIRRQAEETKGLRKKPSSKKGKTKEQKKRKEKEENEKERRRNEREHLKGDASSSKSSSSAASASSSTSASSSISASSNISWRVQSIQSSSDDEQHQSYLRETEENKTRD